MFVGTVNISAFVVTRMAAMGAELACSGGRVRVVCVSGETMTPSVKGRSLCRSELTVVL